MSGARFNLEIRPNDSPDFNADPPGATATILEHVARQLRAGLMTQSFSAVPGGEIIGSFELVARDVTGE